jgi:hypothetical protein
MFTDVSVVTVGPVIDACVRGTYTLPCTPKLPYSILGPRITLSCQQRISFGQFRTHAAVTLLVTGKSTSKSGDAHKATEKPARSWL